MKILVGTSNPSKVDYFRQVFAGRDVTILTPRDLEIDGEPEESGRNPVENAVIKARFYGQYADCVICADSGLYFDGLPYDDPRQPGLHVRTPHGVRLDDEQMIAHYAALAHELGGKALAYYLDAMALLHKGQIHTFEATREELHRTAFYMIDTPFPERRPGWPIDSISIDQDGTPFLSPDRKRDAQQQWGYMQRLQEFLFTTLGL